MKVQVLTYGSPTDTRWQTDPIRDYYVTFWTQPHVPGATDYEKIGWRSEMYEVFDAVDVVEVVEWAERGAKERDAMYTIYARIERAEPHGPGLIYLAGVDPTTARKWSFETVRPAGATPMAGGTQPFRRGKDEPDA